jgi:hypothetical protein
MNLFVIKGITNAPLVDVVRGAAPYVPAPEDSRLRTACPVSAHSRRQYFAAERQLSRVSYPPSV